MSLPDDKTKRVFEHLKRCAHGLYTTTYQEVSDAAGLGNAQNAGRHLGYIRDELCRKRGLPWINALAVSKETLRPSDGFLPEGLTIPELDWEPLWRGMVLQVYAFDWRSVSFDQDRK